MSIEKLCRIFHISDLHVVTQATQERVAKTAHVGVAALRHLFWQGCAPHDPEALVECGKAIQAEIDKDPGWQTIIIATGDLSTWGDKDSIEEANRFLKRVSAETRSKRFLLYGNHDVWPGEDPWFPIFASQAQLSGSVDKAAGVLSPASSLRIPGAISIELHLLNTVTSSRWLNALAWGRLDQESQLRLQAEGSTLDCVGIGLTHHPVHDTKTFPAPSTLMDRSLAAAAMQSDGGPRIRLVLSGHRHQVNPAAGSLNSSWEHGQAPLGPAQIQLTAGTVSQRPDCRDAPDNTFQMIRLGLKTPDLLMVERTVFRLPNGIGSFVKMGANAEASAEVCSIPLR